MQQFPVPQFTDIEDKIIGRFTIKQFGIIFGAGALVFLVFSSTKNIPATIIAGIILGIPAVGLALLPFNGRPLYNTLPVFFRFLASNRLFMFRKQSQDHQITSLKSLQNNISDEIVIKKQEPDPTGKLREIQYMLQQKAKEEQEILKEIPKRK